MSIPLLSTKLGIGLSFFIIIIILVVKTDIVLFSFKSLSLYFEKPMMLLGAAATLANNFCLPPDRHNFWCWSHCNCWSNVSATPTKCYKLHQSTVGEHHYLPLYLLYLNDSYVSTCSNIGFFWCDWTNYFWHDTNNYFRAVTFIEMNNEYLLSLKTEPIKVLLPFEGFFPLLPFFITIIS